MMSGREDPQRSYRELTFRAIATRRFFLYASLVPLAVPVLAWLAMHALLFASGPGADQAPSQQGTLGLIVLTGLWSAGPYGLYLAFVWLVWRPQRSRALLSAVAGGVIVPPAILCVALLLYAKWRAASPLGATLFWVEIAVGVALVYASLILLAFAIARRRHWII